ncbi:MAG: hypothetical protein U0169_22000 [Polyangiaceae bacterium]
MGKVRGVASKGVRGGRSTLAFGGMVLLAAVVHVAACKSEATEEPSDAGPDDASLVSTDAAPSGNDGGPVTATEAGAKDGSTRDVAVVTGPCDLGDGTPKDLECTGLYANFATKTIAATALPYAPSHELWSDGAKKSRWIEIPAGKKIDVTNLNAWTFPVGTKVWKEFRLVEGARERRIETRFMVKLEDESWYRVSFAWSADESTTTQVADGVEKVANTADYGIPGTGACERCHNGRTDNLLGFETLLLASPGATGLTFSELEKKGWLQSTNGNHLLDAGALAFPGTAVESAALATLHVNCGVSCHNSNDGSSRFKLDVLLDGGVVPAVKDTRAFKEGVNQESGYRPRGDDGGIVGGDENTTFYRLRPTDPAHSTIHYRMVHRNTPASNQIAMPPLASRQPDTAGGDAVRAWVEAMTPANGYPAPASLTP